MPAMLASSTCEVQMLELAFSRRMCCSRVCSAMRSAGVAARVLRDADDAAGHRAHEYSSRVAKKAACGPPKPIGTPKRWPSRGDVGAHGAG
jgi:hypothetical protein